MAEPSDLSRNDFIDIEKTLYISGYIASPATATRIRMQEYGFRLENTALIAIRKFDFRCPFGIIPRVFPKG